MENASQTMCKPRIGRPVRTGSPPVTRQGIGPPPPPSASLTVAQSAPGICEGPAPRRDEPPLVAVRMEGELQDAVGLVVVDLAVGDGLQDRVVALASGANHKLPDAALGVWSPVRVLRREALVVVLVAGEHHVYARCVENVP